MLTDDQLNEARKMRDAGAAWEVLEAHFGLSVFRIRCEVDAAYREKRRLQKRAKRPSRGLGMVAAGLTADYIPKATIAARLAEIPPDTRSKTARLFGDPLPGRSALDRRLMA